MLANDEDRDSRPCCADPLCPCDYKPGWGPYSPVGAVLE